MTVLFRILIRFMSHQKCIYYAYQMHIYAYYQTVFLNRITNALNAFQIFAFWFFILCAFRNASNAHRWNASCISEMRTWCVFKCAFLFTGSRYNVTVSVRWCIFIGDIKGSQDITVHYCPYRLEFDYCWKSIISMR